MRQDTLVVELSTIKRSYWFLADESHFLLLIFLFYRQKVFKKWWITEMNFSLLISQGSETLQYNMTYCTYSLQTFQPWLPCSAQKSHNYHRWALVSQNRYSLYLPARDRCRPLIGRSRGRHGARQRLGFLVLWPFLWVFQLYTESLEPDRNT